MSACLNSTHLLIGEKRIEVRVACSHTPQLEWCVLACLIENGRRPFDVVATGVSKGSPDEEVAIRLALLNLSEKVSWQDQELVAQALVQPMGVVISRQSSLRGIISRKPREASEVAALLRGNLPTEEPV